MERREKICELFPPKVGQLEREMELLPVGSIDVSSRV